MIALYFGLSWRRPPLSLTVEKNHAICTCLNIVQLYQGKVVFLLIYKHLSFPGEVEQNQFTSSINQSDIEILFFAKHRILPTRRIHKAF